MARLNTSSIKNLQLHGLLLGLGPFFFELSYRPSKATVCLQEKIQTRNGNLARRVVFNVKVIDRGLFKGKTKVYKIRGGEEIKGMESRREKKSNDSIVGQVITVTVSIDKIGGLNGGGEYEAQGVLVRTIMSAASPAMGSQAHRQHRTVHGQQYPYPCFMRGTTAVIPKVEKPRHT